MNPRVLRRFIILTAIATFVMFTVWAVINEFFIAPADGDYEVRKGDILLSDKEYDQAIEWFDKALAITTNHRGALMGRGIAFLQSGRYDQAEAEFTYLIGFLKDHVAPDDPTGFAVLAGAYANRGILYDRTGRYKQALADYDQAVAIDKGAVDGPSLFDKILYGTPQPATVEKRAQYLREQLALPEDQRLLHLPEKDQEQRMYKP